MGILLRLAMVCVLGPGCSVATLTKPVCDPKVADAAMADALITFVAAAVGTGLAIEDRACTNAEGKSQLCATTAFAVTGMFAASGAIGFVRWNRCKEP